MNIDQELAIFGGPKAVKKAEPELFHWPIVTEEDEQAVLEVLRAGSMSGLDITRKFEEEFAEYLGVKYALGHSSGTLSLLVAMYASGVGRGDEVICPSITLWASVTSSFLLGATPVFSDIDPKTICIDPDDIVRHISPRTRAIVVVHYSGHPCDMDPIMAVARKHDLKVIEDVSHAQGGKYKGRMLGTIGDAAGMSLMSGKSFAIGEAGMLCTEDREIYERAVAFAHYARGKEVLTIPYLKETSAADGFAAAVPLGGLKARMNQMCSSMGRVQLRYYPERITEIQNAVNRFWDLLADVPGLRPVRVQPDTGSTMGGWFYPLGHYDPETFGGLPVNLFIEALSAEGAYVAGRSVNFPLHLHPVFNEADIFGDGKPTRIAFSSRDVRQPKGSLPAAERIAQYVVGIPWFKHDRPESIAPYAAAYKKVARQAVRLKK